jgi:uncharacterized membrane protein YbhN (UPF0104 family)/tRNA A-37 threonylcarbamoyl transferase component Bud32
VNRYFISDPDQPRARRAADAVSVAVGVVLVLWTGFTADRVLGIEQALVDLTGSFPTWFDQLFEFAYLVGALMVIVLFVAVVAQGRKRLDLLRDMAVALAASFGLALLLVWLVDGTFPVVLPEFNPVEPEPAFPVLRVAMVTSVISVAGPQLARPVRRFGWTMVVLVAISSFAMGFGFPGDALGGIGVGLIAAGATLLVFGSARGYPNLQQVTTGLADLNLTVSDLELTPDQSWGVRRLSGVLDDGRKVEVKAYGRDATDSQLMSKAWRNLWYREEGQQFTFSRLQGVEHEALATLKAKQSGVEVPELLGVGVGGDDVALLAVSLRGEPLEPRSMSRSSLVAAWRQLGLLHDAGIAHGSLTLEALTIEGDQPVLRELNAASFSPSEARLDLDVVSLLYETAVQVGAENAVGAAVAGLGDDRLVAALPYLQPPALSRTQRRAVDKPKAITTELRETIAATTGTELPEPAKLRRLRWQDFVMPALSLVALYALMGLLSDIDFAAVWDVVQDANWAWILVGFMIGQFVFFPEATGMMFATGYPLPLRPLVILQISVKWIGLAIPSAAGRVTMNTLFLRKFGVPPTIALTQGAIDGVSGFIVEFGILVVAFIASDLSLNFDTEEIRWGLILLIVALLIGAGVVAVWRIKRLHDAVVPVLADVWQLLWGVLKDPKRALGLLGSNLASRLILAVTLWFILQAIGEPLSLVTCLVVTVATNLLAGLVPIPGGIGVAEAVLTSFLVLAGLGVDEAFAAAVVFRMATFYVPAGEGFFALKWLKARDYV